MSKKSDEAAELKMEVMRLRAALEHIVWLGDPEKHTAFDGERHRQMRHSAMAVLNDKKLIGTG